MHVIFVAARVGERAQLVAVVIHIDARRRHGRDPDRAAVLRAVTAARPPGDHSFRRQTILRQQREAPVVGCVGRRARARRGQGEKLLSAGAGETGAGILRHLKLKHTAGARHGKTPAADAGGIVDRNRRRVRVVKVNERGVSVGRGADRRHVTVTPLVRRIERKPVRRVMRADVADDKIDLHRFCGVDAAALFDAAVDEIRFTAIQGHRERRRCAGTIGVNRHRSSILFRHHHETHVLEQRIRHVLSHRADVARAVINRRSDLNRAGQHRAGGGGPRGARNHQRLGGCHAIPRVEEQVRRVARQGNEIAQREHRARRERGRVVGVTRRDAVGIVPVAPDLRGGLRRVGNVCFVTVLPLIVVNHRSLAGDDHRENRIEGCAHVGLQRGERLSDLRLWHGQVEIVHQRGGAAGRNRTPQRANRCQPVARRVSSARDLPRIGEKRCPWIQHQPANALPDIALHHTFRC